MNNAAVAKRTEAESAVVWLRSDLRLTDNPAFHAATRGGGPVTAVFVWAPEEEGHWPPGAASRWWLHHSLKALSSGLEGLGIPLVIRRGPSLDALREVLQEAGASSIYWNRRYEPAALKRDQFVETTLREENVAANIFDGNLLTNPFAIRNKSQKPFQVFTAFWRHCLAGLDPEEPLAKPRRVSAAPARVRSLSLESLELLPKIDWAAGITAAGEPGESGGLKRLREFCANGLAAYLVGRDKPGQIGTSRLSPHLHFGEIGPRQIWHAVRSQADKSSRGGQSWRQSQFLTELGWREFAHYLLCHFPHTTDRPLRPEFAAFPWRKNAAGLRAWQRGQTGYPLVDAGMRELWTTGWMHNRVRMIVASFLVKHLLVPWQDGAKWFWDTLVDADLANNTMGWQWTSGCGADAAPFFRIFNPVIQGEKFDPHGDYVRRWVPELARLESRWIHQPWQAPARALAAAEIKLGTTYPQPLVDHSVARDKALEAFAQLKASH